MLKGFETLLIERYRLEIKVDKFYRQQPKRYQQRWKLVTQLVVHTARSSFFSFLSMTLDSVRLYREVDKTVQYGGFVKEIQRMSTLNFTCIYYQNHF